MRITIANVSLLTLSILVAPTLSATCTDPVYMPDQALRQAILDWTGGSSVTCASLGSMVTFFAPNKGISNIEGLQYATRVEELNLTSNNISDLSPLSGMSNRYLRTLVLIDNQVTNASPLFQADFPILTNLALSENPLNGFSGITAFGALEGFHASNCGVSNGHLSALVGLNNLKYLVLRGNNITSIANLANVGRYTLESLYIPENQITDLTPISNHSQLIQIIAFYNPISILPALPAGMAELNFYGCNLNNISSLAALTNLQRVTLSANRIQNISALSNKPVLETLLLDDNKISNISPLGSIGSSFLYRVDISLNCLKLSDSSTQAIISDLLGQVGDVTFTPQNICRSKIVVPPTPL